MTLCTPNINPQNNSQFSYKFIFIYFTMQSNFQIYNMYRKEITGYTVIEKSKGEPILVAL